MDEYYLTKIKNIFKDNSAYRKIKGKSKGKLSAKSLHKISYSNKIFEQKGGLSRKQYDIAFTVDVSGSLDWRGLIPICQYATIELLSNFQGLCNLQFATYNTTIEICKPFNSARLSQPEIKAVADTIKTRAKDHSTAYGNHDGFALAETAKLILRQPGKDKIIFMITDGHPNCDKAICKRPGCFKTEGMRANLIETANKVKQQGIHLIGLGLGTDSVSNYYENFVVCSDETKFYHDLILVLNSLVKRKVGV